MALRLGVVLYMKPLKDGIYIFSRRRLYHTISHHISKFYHITANDNVLVDFPEVLTFVPHCSKYAAESKKQIVKAIQW